MPSAKEKFVSLSPKRSPEAGSLWTRQLSAATADLSAAVAVAFASCSSSSHCIRIPGTEPEESMKKGPSLFSTTLSDKSPTKFLLMAHSPRVGHPTGPPRLAARELVHLI